MSNIKSNDLSNFKFKKVGYGHYEVKYTTPVRGDYYVAIIDDMLAIDHTLKSEIATISSIKDLIRIVKLKGIHYSSTGKEICK